MKKSSRQQPGFISQAHLSTAVREVANAIRQERRQEKRIEVGKHLMALGNLAAGALVFTQAFSGFTFDLKVALVGLLTLVLLYATAVFVMEGGDHP